MCEDCNLDPDHCQCTPKPKKQEIIVDPSPVNWLDEKEEELI
jgi:hypothetical protein